MKYTVCTDALFHGQDTVSGMELAKKCGYDAIEFWTWWDKDLAPIREAAQRLNMKIVTFCTDFTINIGNPETKSAYLEGLERSIEAAKYLQCDTLIAQAGWEIPGVSYELHRETLLQVLQSAVPLLEKSDMKLVLEPLNTRVDHPGYHLVHTQDAFSVIQAINSPRIRLLFDIYHQQISDGNILASVRDHIDMIGHFHIAAVPGRIEPLAGELNYPLILSEIDKLGYAGYTGLEYMPKKDAAETLRQTRAVLL